MERQQEDMERVKRFYQRVFLGAFAVGITSLAVFEGPVWYKQFSGSFESMTELRSVPISAHAVVKPAPETLSEPAVASPAEPEAPMGPTTVDYLKELGFVAVAGVAVGGVVWHRTRQQRRAETAALQHLTSEYDAMPLGRITPAEREESRRLLDMAFGPDEQI